MNLTERAAYLKGLAEGLGLEPDKKETRIINEMLELLSELASDVEDIGEDLTDLYEAVDEIDEDLAAVENDLYMDLEDDDFDEDIYEITCPNCQETVCLGEEMIFEEEITCPSCGEKLEIEIDDNCECGCCSAEEKE